MESCDRKENEGAWRVMKQKSIKNIRKEFRDHGVFYTPPELAEKLKSYIDIEPRSVYDPTCGAGNLLRVFNEDVKKYGQELDGEQLALIDIPNFSGYAGDTLADDGFKGMTFDCIVANPPFSVKWDPEKVKDDIRFAACGTFPPPSKADWAFMLHILHHLSENGTAAVLEFPGILYRGQREGKIRQWFIENNYIDRVVEVPGNTFEDTAISTCIVVLKKNRISKDITFEREDRSITVPYEEIFKNSFTLSVSTYIPEEIEKEEVDPLRLEDDARNGFLERLRKELEFEKMVCEMEEISMQPFIEKVRRTLDEYDCDKGRRARKMLERKDIERYERNARRILEAIVTGWPSIEEPELIRVISQELIRIDQEDAEKRDRTY